MHVLDHQHGRLGGQRVEDGLAHRRRGDRPSRATTPAARQVAERTQRPRRRQRVAAAAQHPQSAASEHATSTSTDLPAPGSPRDGHPRSRTSRAPAKQRRARRARDRARAAPCDDCRRRVPVPGGPGSDGGPDRLALRGLLRGSLGAELVRDHRHHVGREAAARGRARGSSPRRRPRAGSRSCRRPRSWSPRCSRRLERLHGRVGGASDLGQLVLGQASGTLDLSFDEEPLHGYSLCAVSRPVAGPHQRRRVPRDRHRW